jgi:4-amino-4-deoxy-L-arabinose transferase-like glycosyltransferase
MTLAEPETHLRRLDFVLLGLFCFCLFGFAIVPGPVLSGHEAVLPQNTREMLADHDWLIPKMGGEPWLERPPLPDWILAATAWSFGERANDRVARVAPAIIATLIVLMLVGMAARWFGRTIGILSGLIIATMWEFFFYASDPEADIFLCAIVTAAMAFFVRAEFPREVRDDTESASFFGKRPWPVLAFFVFLGLTNMAKGLIFGTLMVAVPIAGFLAWNADLRAIRRYVWFWGWLACAVVALAWPVAAYLQHPEIRDLWEQHYLGRLNRGYIGEPAWYYLTAIPYILLPWTIPAFLGLWMTRRQAWTSRYGAQRFLWCWAILTPAFFSIPDGKHHHYLLQCMAPWAVLAALGAVRIWQWFGAWPNWLRNPVWSLPLVALPCVVALFVFRSKIPGPSWLVPNLLVIVPVFIFCMSWAIGRGNGRIAAGGVFSLLFAFYAFLITYQTLYVDDYQNDRVFLQEVQAVVGPERPVFINFDMSHPLETAWLLYYSGDRIVLLDEISALAKKEVEDRDVFLVARMRDRDEVLQLGGCEVALQSKHTRGERTLGDRRTLFRVRLESPAMSEH